MKRKAGQRVWALERRMEGLRLVAYKRPGDVWTIGFGHTKGVHKGDEISAQTAEHLLAGDMADAESYLNGALAKVPGITQGIFDALVDFIIQFGATKFSQSTLYQRLLQQDFGAAAQELLRWVHDSNHNVLSELVERRKIAHGWFTEQDNGAA